MRATAFPALLIIAAAAATSAHAQGKKDAKPASAGTEVRYFTSISGLMDDQADAILKETRSAGKVTGAELDVCYPATPNSDRKDRFVATLTADGQKLLGTTETINGKQPVSINLVQKSLPGGVTFEGKITVGGNVSNIASTDNSDISEKEFKTSEEADDEIIAAPADFTTASPEAVAVRLKPEAVVDFVNGLRGQNVEVSLISLLPSCAELRKGEQAVHLNIDPERAAEFVARVKSTPGIVAAGWTAGKLDMDRTVRVAATDWRDGGKLAKDKLATKLTAALATALTATPQSSTWNDDNGGLTLTFKRPYAGVPALGLTQTIEVAAMAAADKPGGTDRLLIWLGFPTVTTTDDSTGAKLKIIDASDNNGEESVPVDTGDTVTAVAHALKAQRWDADNNSWK